MARLEALYTGDGSDLEYTGKKKVVIAPGRYEAIIVASKLVDNKAKNGKNLVLTHQIIKGEYKDEEIKEWLAVVNPNVDAQNIAQAKKARLGIILLGTKNPDDSDFFLCKHSKRVHVIETDTEPNSYKNKTTGETVDSVNNIIKNYHPVNGTFKELKDVVEKGGVLPPVIAHSTIANGAGGSHSVEDDLDSIPF